MQRVSSYCFCEKCKGMHLVSEGDCFPRFRIFTDDTGEDGYLIAARTKSEAAQLYVNGYDEDYELVNRDAVKIVVGDRDGRNKEAFNVSAEIIISYTASPAI